MEPINFVPVVVGMDDTQLAKRDPNGHDFSWWTPDAYFFHEWFLTSPATHWRQRRIRGRYHVPDGMHALYDSGGFLRYKGQFDGTGEQVLSWYEANARKGDRAMILDTPPAFKTKTGVGTHMSYRQATDEEFEQCLERTVRDSEIMARKKRGDYTLLHVIQGMTLKRMVRWAKVLEQKLGEPEGVAFAPKMNLRALILTMVMVKEMYPKKPVHLLGLSGMRATAAAAYLSRHTDCSITFDSSTPTYMGSKMDYLLPGQPSHFVRFMRGENKYDRLGCDCPVCAQNFWTDLRGDAPDAVPLITLHNLFQIKRWTDLMDMLKTDKQEFIRLIPEDGMACVSAFDYYLENGWEKTLLNEHKLVSRTTVAGMDGMQSHLGEFDGEYVPAEICEACLKSERPVHTHRDVEGMWMALCKPCFDTIEAIEITVARKRVVAAANGNGHAAQEGET